MCRLCLLTCFVIQLGRLCSARSEHCSRLAGDHLGTVTLSFLGFLLLDHATAALHCRMCYRQPLL